MCRLDDRHNDDHDDDGNCYTYDDAHLKAHVVSKINRTLGTVAYLHIFPPFENIKHQTTADEIHTQQTSTYHMF